MRRTHLLCFAVALLLAAPAMADSINPSSMTFDVDLDSLTVDGETVRTFTKTVTIDAISDAYLDVFFLFDAKSSQGGLIDVAKDSAADLVGELYGTYTAGNLRVGVGYYQDFPTVAPSGISWGDSTAVPWALVQEMTALSADQTTAQAQLAGYLAGVPSDGVMSSGLDAPGSGLYALHNVATLPAINWDTVNGAERVVVWMGDTPNWDGDLTPAYPSDIGLADVMAALSSEHIIVEAISVGSGAELDGVWTGTNGTAGPGQATAITNATGGNMFDLSTLTIEALVAKIEEAIGTVFATYYEVGLDLTEPNAIPGLTVTYDGPASNPDGWDRTETRLFGFTVTLTPDSGLTDAITSFKIYGTLDGDRIVTERDYLDFDGSNNPGGDVPEPSTIALMGLGLLGVGFAARRKLRKS